jgi:hypothetical protein
MARSSDAILNLLNSASSVTRLQLAPGSEWENCLVVKKQIDADITAQWLNRFTSEYIGVEAFFDMPNENISDAFAGIRAPASENNIEIMLRMTRKFLNSSFTIADFLDEAKIASGGDLFAGEPDFLELGVVNYWNSFGAMRFWKSGSGSEYTAFENALKTRVDFMSVLPAPAAIESAFSAPLPHWLGIPVSSEKNGEYFLSVQQAKTVLERIAG